MSEYINEHDAIYGPMPSMAELRVMRDNILKLKSDGLVKRDILARLDISERNYMRATQYLKFLEERIVEEKRPYHVLQCKVKYFKERNGNLPSQNYTYIDVINKFGPTPKCYITGREIDYNINNYALDHIVPVSKGGSNELDNMGICDGWANMIKSYWSIEQMYGLMIKTLTYAGYKVTKEGA